MNKTEILLGILIISLGFFIGMLVKNSLLIDFKEGRIITYDATVNPSCKTNSMGLTINCNDKLYLKKFKGDLRKGGIYIYRKNESTTVVHRLIGCVDYECNTTIFKGDNTLMGELVNKTQILYRVEMIELWR